MPEVTDPPLPFISLCYFLIGHFLPFHWKKHPYKAVLSRTLHADAEFSSVCPSVPCSCHNRVTVARAERLRDGTQDRLRGTDCLAAFSRVGWGQCQGGCRACCAGKSSLHLRGGVENKNPIYACMHTHRRAHTQVSPMFPIVNATQICSMQTHVNTWIWLEVRRQSNTCTNTHANELYRGSVVCGNGPSSPAHILFPDLTSARLFRED